MSTKKPEIVVVTGATAGVGRATVRAFARQGAHLGLLARGEEALAATRAEVEAAGGRAVAVPTDVADAAQVDAAAEQIERELGPVDIWVNNAMTSVFSPFKKMNAEEFRRVTEVCYLGFVYGTMAALRSMLPRNQGTIVQVGSTLAYRGIPLQSAYCGAKHAIQGFTESVRAELMHDHSDVHITMVQMPALNTPQFGWVKSRLPNKAQPVPPLFQPEVAADAIVWAAHQRRREVSVTFNNSMFIWGNKFFPGIGDWYLARTGYDSQQTDEPRDPERPHNLWQPVAGDFGAHGDFDARAHNSSWFLQLNKRLNLAILPGLALVGVAAALWARMGDE
ncbi:MAG: SDR family oxidoreductase [Anaerolineaceae bacterium]|nr:SDR family oxidoreductase [Anaerolineaceae bacterium]